MMSFDKGVSVISVSYVIAPEGWDGMVNSRDTAFEAFLLPYSKEIRDKKTVIRKRFPCDTGK